MRARPLGNGRRAERLLSRCAVGLRCAIALLGAGLGIPGFVAAACAQATPSDLPRWSWSTCLPEHLKAPAPSATLRNPFRAGDDAAAEVPPGGDSLTEEQQRSLSTFATSIRSVIDGPRPLALIGDRLHEAGDTLTLEAHGVRARILRIRSTSLTLALWDTRSAAEARQQEVEVPVPAASSPRRSP